ncbi:MAG TPA: hypothetical protein VFA78_02370 [Chloroflexota bacterium]|nr:hypothetical protein [Chloroflexota bacterium]
MMVKSAELPPELLDPTYQNRLRVIGRRLDLGGYRSLNLVEIAGGFLARAMRPGERAPQALEFPHADFPRLIGAAFAERGRGQRLGNRHELVPTGYEDFLRALGHRLDEQHAEAIAITELGNFIAVNGVAPVETYHQTAMAPFQSLLRPDDIATLLNEAFQRRAPEPQSLRARIFSRA